MTVDAAALKDTLDSHTDPEWMVVHDTPAKLRLTAVAWDLTVEARNPTEDNTWRLTLTDKMNDDEYAVAPVKTDSVGLEAKALVDKHTDF